MNRRSILAACALAAFAATPLAPTFAGEGGTTPAPEGAAVYFITPTEGETLASPVTVRFGLTGLGVAPAGVEQENTGHHHLIVDAELPAFDAPIPADENYIHFGGGQTETTIELPPGEHTLQLIMGDWSHVPHNPPLYSERITITVE